MEKSPYYLNCLVTDQPLIEAQISTTKKNGLDAQHDFNVLNEIVLCS